MDSSDDNETHQLYQPEDAHLYDNPRTKQQMEKNRQDNTQKSTTAKLNLSLSLRSRKKDEYSDFLEKNKDSPYLQPVDYFGNFPPPLLSKSKTDPTLTQPIRPAKILPPTTPRSPRKYTNRGQEDIPYTKRMAWQAQSEAYHLKKINQKHHQERNYSKIYSVDHLRHRQLSIQRVSDTRRIQEIEEKRQRYQECKEHQKSVQYEERHQRFYNDEIFSRTGKQYRYIPNHDRANPNNEYIYI